MYAVVRHLDGGTTGFSWRADACACPTHFPDMRAHTQEPTRTDAPRHTLMNTNESLKSVIVMIFCARALVARSCAPLIRARCGAPHLPRTDTGSAGSRQVCA